MNNTNNSNGSAEGNRENANVPTRTVIIPIEVSALIELLQQNSLESENPDFVNLKRFLGPVSLLEVDYDRSSSSFQIQPTSTVLPRPMNNSTNVFKCYGKLGSCGFGCWTPTTTLQTLVIDNDQYKMTVVFRPSICCRSDKGRILDIFIPERTERIGWIETDGDIADLATISVGGTPSQFTMKRNRMDNEEKMNPLSVTVEDREKQTVAVGKATHFTRTQGSCGSRVDIHKFQFSIGSYDTQIRAVLFATFAVMIFDLKEQSVINTKFWVVGILLAILAVFVFLSFQ